MVPKFLVFILSLRKVRLYWSPKWPSLFKISNRSNVSTNHLKGMILSFQNNISNQQRITEHSKPNWEHDNTREKSNTWEAFWRGAARCRWLCGQEDTLVAEKDTSLGVRRPLSPVEGSCVAGGSRVRSISLCPPSLSRRCAFVNLKSPYLILFGNGLWF